MINNRQQGGRRRGRGGGPRSPNIPNTGGGNRQDNRQRGNAAQLLEKYKAMARDAQLAGDRVQTEYYLQFADHYHRVLSETRSRFEEQNPRRQQGDFSDEDEGDEEMSGADAGYNNGRGDRGDYQQQPQQQQRDQQQREYREPREQREQRDYQPREQRADEEQGEQGGQQDRNVGELRPRRERAPRRERPELNGEAAEERIALDVLPPAIGAADTDPAPRPRRTRRPRPAEGGEEIAPAA